MPLFIISQITGIFLTERDIIKFSLQIHEKRKPSAKAVYACVCPLLHLAPPPPQGLRQATLTRG